MNTAVGTKQIPELFFILGWCCLVFHTTPPPPTPPKKTWNQQTVLPPSALLQSVAIATLHTHHHTAGCASSSGQTCQLSSLRVSRLKGLNKLSICSSSSFRIWKVLTIFSVLVHASFSCCGDENLSEVWLSTKFKTLHYCYWEQKSITTVIELIPNDPESEWTAECFTRLLQRDMVQYLSSVSSPAKKPTEFEGPWSDDYYGRWLLLKFEIF